jgi:hypothetical protein
VNVAVGIGKCFALQITSNSTSEDVPVIIDRSSAGAARDSVPDDWRLVVRLRVLEMTLGASGGGGVSVNSVN